jgi:hypothetical protein
MMPEIERELLRKYHSGHRMFAEINGRRLEVLYSSRFNGDLLPWIVLANPSMRFVSESVTVEVITCAGCGAEVGPHLKYNPKFPVMDRCVTCAVAELAGDLVQIEKGTMK